MMFETTMDCEWGGLPCSDLFSDKVLQYKSDFDLDIVQRFYNGKRMVQIFQILKERKKSFQICITGSSR
jgi:hypothetical protein